MKKILILISTTLLANIAIAQNCFYNCIGGSNPYAQISNVPSSVYKPGNGFTFNFQLNVPSCMYQTYNGTVIVYLMSPMQANLGTLHTGTYTINPGDVVNINNITFPDALLPNGVNFSGNTWGYAIACDFTSTPACPQDVQLLAAPPLISIDVLSVPNGIEENKLNIVAIVPNPAINTIQLSNVNEAENIKVVNIIGDLMPVKLLSKNLLDVQNYPSGLYYIQFVNNNKLETVHWNKL